MQKALKSNKKRFDAKGTNFKKMLAILESEDWKILFTQLSTKLTIFYEIYSKA